MSKEYDVHANDNTEVNDGDLEEQDDDAEEILLVAASSPSRSTPADITAAEENLTENLNSFLTDGNEFLDESEEEEEMLVDLIDVVEENQLEVVEFFDETKKEINKPTLVDLDVGITENPEKIDTKVPLNDIAIRESANAAKIDTKVSLINDIAIQESADAAKIDTKVPLINDIAIQESADAAKIDTKVPLNDIAIQESADAAKIDTKVPLNDIAIQESADAAEDDENQFYEDTIDELEYQVFDDFIDMIDDSITLYEAQDFKDNIDESTEFIDECINVCQKNNENVPTSPSLKDVKTVNTVEGIITDTNQDTSLVKEANLVKNVVSPDIEISENNKNAFQTTSYSTVQIDQPDEICPYSNEIELKPSEPLDESIIDKRSSCSKTCFMPDLTDPNLKYDCIALPGAQSFLEFDGPPDDNDVYAPQDKVETNMDVNCPVLNVANVFEDDDDEVATHKNALSLIKCFGQEKRVPVLSVSKGDHLAILYACSHTGVIYDVDSKRQFLLQGHSNSVSCLTASFDKNWAVVGDKGPESVVNVWHISADSKQMTPVRTFFNFQSHGVSAIAMSFSGNILAILSADEPQRLSIWNWTDPNDSPINSIEIDPKYGYQNYLLFNPDDATQLVSNSESQVVFYSWNESHISLFAPQLHNIDMAKQVGKFTATVFLKNSSSALSATSIGKFLVWEKYRPIMLDALTPYKRIHKIVRMQNKCISVLTTVKNFIVTGDVIGQIKFYDETLKLVNWFQDFNLGSITSISFDFDPDYDRLQQSESVFKDPTAKESTFSTQNFIFGTSMARFVYVTANGTKYEIVNEDFECQVEAMDVHPNKPLVVLGGFNGFVRILHYQTGNAVASKVFDGGKTAISCLAYNHDGSMIGVGFANGKVEVLHGLNLQSFCKSSLNNTTDSITHILFSPNLDFLATADKGFAVTLYSIVKDSIWIDDTQNFQFIGRYRAHNKPIRSIMFRPKTEESSLRFFSMGMDRYLVEYNIGNPGLTVKSHDRLEQFGVPLCMSSYPLLSKEDLILTCNDEFKFKLVNSATKMCRKTLLGPIYGVPINKFLISSCNATGNVKKHFMAFMLDDKIGISLLPITGNQHQSISMISHPMGVQNIAISYNGKYLFSVGGKSASLLMWSINLVALEVQEQLGGSDLAPFYEQIEGGRNGAFMYELENMFYYAQIRSQGINTYDKRNVGAKIPLSEIASIMRVLGFFPTEQEIQEMINEIRYENYAATGKTVEKIDVEQFLKLYINHRPVRSTQESQIEWAFKVLGIKENKNSLPTINEKDLMKSLLERGEPMSENELAECLATFAGISSDADSCTTHIPSTSLNRLIPDSLTAESFRNLLGFNKK